MKTLLSKGHEDLSFLSRLLMLPTESYLLANMAGTDVELIHQARDFVKQQLALACEDLLNNYYQKYHTTSAYQYNQQAVGQRSIKNSCLAYLLETGKAQYQDLAYQQFSASQNMTDTMGALAALNNHDCKQREQALEAFYKKWQKEALVVNKWLGLQAISSLPQTLDKVKALLQHPGFDILNPNNCYALLGGFGANTYRFHANGEGYQFMADQVITIDKNNSLVAGRLIQPLTRWQQVDQERAKQMKQALQKIAATPQLSKDVYEVISKSI